MVFYLGQNKETRFYKTSQIGQEDGQSEVEVTHCTEKVVPKCPKCGEEIDHILAQTDATQEITKDTDDINWVIDHEWITYSCPKCGEDIGVDSFDDAVELMKR